MKRGGGKSNVGLSVFWSVANINQMLSQMLLPDVAVFTKFEDLAGRGSNCFSSSPLPPPSVHGVVFISFNRALFLQCSHVTSMQSPYVLNSNVVDYRRILHKPLS